MLAAQAPARPAGALRLAWSLVRLWWGLSRISRALDRIESTGAFAPLARRARAELPAPLWAAALDPRRAYGEAGDFWARLGAGRERELSAEVRAAAARLRVHAHLIPEPVLAPIDALRAADRWEIGADEGLVASHPCLAIAYLSRLEEMERQGVGAVALGAGRLARALAGRGHPGDSPDPDALRGFEKSSAARARLPRVMEAALPLIQLEREAREIGRSALPATAPSRPAPRI